MWQQFKENRKLCHHSKGSEKRCKMKENGRQNTISPYTPRNSRFITNYVKKWANREKLLYSAQNSGIYQLIVRLVWAHGEKYLSSTQNHKILRFSSCPLAVLIIHHFISNHTIASTIWAVPVPPFQYQTVPEQWCQSSQDVPVLLFRYLSAASQSCLTSHGMPAPPPPYPSKSPPPTDFQLKSAGTSISHNLKVPHQDHHTD